MQDQVDRVNSVARRLRECEGHMRFMRWQKIDGKYEPTSLNTVAAILDDLRREVTILADDLYELHNRDDVYDPSRVEGSHFVDDRN